MTSIAIRVYTCKKEESEIRHSEHKVEHENISRVMTLDTETTTDQFQNLTFGSFKIYNHDSVEYEGIFYNKNILNDKQIQLIKDYCSQNRIECYDSQSFIDSVLYPELLNRTPIIAFNLPFDLSRLIIRCSYARGRFNKGFSFQLSNNPDFPRIKIKHIDTKKSFIQLSSSILNNGENYTQGYFIDVKTLVNAVTNKDLSLAEAAIYFGLEEKKQKREKHGIITAQYIDYNRQDVKVTYILFKRLVEELDKFNVDLPLSKTYSPASIGKAFLKEIGIKPFMELNPSFPKSILGKLMSAFYGGRCELRIRKKPVFVTMLDFFSTYPTLFNLMGFWDYLIAESIEHYDDTESVQKLLENITLESLRDQNFWKELNCLVEIQPNEDILPVRARYDEKGTAYTIGLNHVTSTKSLFYPLCDVIASKLLSGKTPIIKRAIRFKPIGKQQGLKEKEILGIKVNPNNDNLIKLLAEKRYELKQRKDKTSEGTAQLLKILMNSITYGIFIEMNEQGKEKELDVYSDEEFAVQNQEYEQTGFYFNPIISVNLVAGARLLLAMAETLLIKHHTTLAYCDTDSAAVPPALASRIVEFFKTLNPYSFEASIFKVQKEKKWFYGICSKRYVLYDKNEDKFIIEDGDYKLHGLGFLMNPFGNRKDWHKTVWEDILKLHYELIKIEDLTNKYMNSYAVSQLSISSYETHKRFKAMNKNQPIEKQIKPFSFMLIGVGADKDIKPVAPYSHNTQKAVYEPFINYKTGKKMMGEHYWKQLDQTINDFINKKENKLEWDTGELQRKHITVTEIIRIGKETKKIDTTGTLNKPEYETYQNPQELTVRLCNMTVKEARQAGIAKTTLFCIKKRIRQGKKIKIKTKTIRKLIA